MAIIFMALRRGEGLFHLAGAATALLPPILAVASGICNVPPALGCFPTTPMAAELAALAANASAAAAAMLVAAVRRSYVAVAAYIASVALYIYAVMGELNCLALLDDMCNEFLMSRGG